PGARGGLPGHDRTAGARGGGGGGPRPPGARPRRKENWAGGAPARPPPRRAGARGGGGAGGGGGGACRSGRRGGGWPTRAPAARGGADGGRGRSAGGGGWRDRLRRRQFVADAQEAGEARQAVAGQAAVAVGDPAAHRRRGLALGVAEATADAELAAVGGAHQQRAHAAVVAALAGEVGEDLGLGVFVWLVLEQGVAASGSVQAVGPMQDQAFAAGGDHPRQFRVQRRGRIEPALFNQ